MPEPTLDTLRSLVGKRVRLRVSGWDGPFSVVGTLVRGPIEHGWNILGGGGWCFDRPVFPCERNYIIGVRRRRKRKLTAYNVSALLAIEEGWTDAP